MLLCFNCATSIKVCSSRERKRGRELCDMTLTLCRPVVRYARGSSTKPSSSQFVQQEQQLDSVQSTLRITSLQGILSISLSEMDPSTKAAAAAAESFVVRSHENSFCPTRMLYNANCLSCKKQHREKNLRSSMASSKQQQRMAKVRLE